ncbi:MAG: phage tail protein [bacterium]
MRDDVRIRVTDDEGIELCRYTFTGCWPSKLEIATLAAAGPAGLVESLTMTYSTAAVS